MNEQRFIELIDGAAPSLEDYVGFVSVVEKLPGELLWNLAHQSTFLNPILQKVVTTTLQEKVVRDKDEMIAGTLNAVVTRLAASGKQV